MIETAQQKPASETQWPVKRLILFALAPGLVMLPLPYLLSLLDGLGRTVVLSSYFLFEAVLLFAIIAFVGRREGKEVLAVIAYNTPVRWPLFLAFAAAGAAWAIFMRDFFRPQALMDISMAVMRGMDGWPSIFARLPQHDIAFIGIPKVATFVGMIAVAAASAMQTLYFRGFLLSRVDRLGWLAPTLITALFVVFHMGSPWFWPQFLLLTLPWAFIAFWTRNVWIVLVSHVTMNTYSSLLILFGVSG